MQVIFEICLIFIENVLEYNNIGVDDMNTKERLIQMHSLLEKESILMLNALLLQRIICNY